MDGKPYFPLFFDLTEKKVIVVGAGTIAKRRVRVLADFTEHLTLIAPEVNQELLDMEASGRVTILRKKYEREDIYGADLVFAATSDSKINNDIHAACKCLGIPVNVYSDRTKCDFFFPAVEERDYVVTGVSASGRNQKGAQKVAMEIRKLMRESAADTE